MIITDTHAHLYLEHFDGDRDEVIQNAINKGVEYMLLPNIDSHSIPKMIAVCDTYPQHCFPMIGLHPTDVKDNYKEEIEIIEQWIKREKFIAIGEIGIDLYWDKTYYLEQEHCFRYQIELAKEHNLPIVIHARESMKEIFSIMDSIENLPKGVFHCFSGTLEEAYKAIKMGFYIGIGGVVTFKNSDLAIIGKKIGINHILLETDAPFLSPVPYRGKRNESAYTYYVAEKIAELKQMDIKEVANITTKNAKHLFKF